MQRGKRTRHELRCMCSRKPLLAVCGIDDRNKAYIHAKAWKQQRLIHESVIYGPRAECNIKCRDCMRWSRFTLTDDRQPSAQTDVPAPRALNQ